jgi:Tol biopolymer transport system component
MPAFWQDGHGVLYQRSDLSTAVALEGQPTLQYRSRIEQAALDGSNIALVVDDARYPGPAPDGSRIAFVRSTAAGSGLFAHSVDDGTDSPVVAPGQFLATAYPRYSPDGQQIAFAAISRLAPAGSPSQNSPFAWLGATTASAHGFPWEIWLVNADGTDLHNVPDLLDDDPSVAWSPDGSQLLVYGGWGSYVVTLSSGDVDSFAYVAGYGSVACLPVAATPTSNGP